MSYFSFKTKGVKNSEKTRCSSAVNIIQVEKSKTGDATMVADEADLGKKIPKRKERVGGVKT